VILTSCWAPPSVRVRHKADLIRVLEATVDDLRYRLDQADADRPSGFRSVGHGTGADLDVADGSPTGTAPIAPGP
jgi:hypothetical protein